MSLVTEEVTEPEFDCDCWALRDSVVLPLGLYVVDTDAVADMVKVGESEGVRICVCDPDPLGSV